MKAIHNKDYSVVKTLKTGFFGISFSFVLFGGHYKKRDWMSAVTLWWYPY